MFDVGFSELALVFGVALVVLGPKRLPGLVSKVGRWVGKARSMARDFQQQLEHEVNLEELNRITEMKTKEALGLSQSTPDFTGNPAETPPTYPYSSPAAEEPAQTDDTYSHAHAAGDAPMADVAEHAQSDAFPAAEVPVEEAPIRSSFDLSSPDEPRPPADERPHSP